MSRNLDNWLAGYIAYTAEQESPEVFHLWCGVSAIAGALRRRAFFNMGYFTLFPNMYIVLVSPPGKCKKSTAMGIARRRLAKVQGINFTVDSTSRERLIQDLSQVLVDGHSSMTAYSSELASLVTTSQMDMIAFLTDIFDSPDEWTHKTKGGGTNKIKGPFLNLIAGTTPDWIAKAMPLDTIGIGLTSRIVFAYSDKPRAANPFPTLSPAQKKLETLLEEDLQDIADISGEYTFAPDAKEAYVEWYMNRFIEQAQVDPRLAGYYERKSVHLIKLCMIVAASQHSNMEISLQNYQDAKHLLESAEADMPEVFAHVGRNPLNMGYEEMIALLLKRPQGVSRAELLDTFKQDMRKEEMDEVLDTLITIGSIRLAGSIYYATDK